MLNNAQLVLYNYNRFIKVFERFNTVRGLIDNHNTDLIVSLSLSQISTKIHSMFLQKCLQHLITGHLGNKQYTNVQSIRF